MPIAPIQADQALANWQTFDDIIDARSPDEWAHDALPQALNWPTLSNEERIQVGTLYKQVGAFEAKKLGAAMAASNIGRHIATHVQNKPKHWKPLLYCWRGGNRSGALATVLSAIGFQVHLVEGGYKAWRNALLAQFETLVAPLRFHVICGPTGTGKTELLHRLAAHGAQTLDLEALACHRSSVLGALPGQAQPNQKQFDTRLWLALQKLNPAQPVFVECESKRIGNVAMPEALADAMRQSPCIHLSLDATLRAHHLNQSYAHLHAQPEYLQNRLAALTQRLGKTGVAQLQALADAQDWTGLVQRLLQTHYDPAYQSSITKQFVGAADGPTHTLAAKQLSELPMLWDEVAQKLVRETR